MLLERQLWDSSLLRLWRTGADYHQFKSDEDDDMDDVRHTYAILLLDKSMSVHYIYRPMLFVSK